MKPHSVALVGISLGLSLSLGVFIALRAWGAEPLSAFTVGRGGIARLSHAVLAMGLILVLAVLLRGVGAWREVLPNGSLLAVSAGSAVVAPLLIAWLWSASAGGSMSDLGVTLGPVLFVYLGAALLLGAALFALGAAGAGQGSRLLGYGALALFPLSAVAYLLLRLVVGPGVTPIIGGLVLAVLAAVTAGASALTAGPGRLVFAIAFVCAWVVLGRIAAG